MIYLCATPIGNLEDITLRVVRILREADVIYAEDTRHTLQLLNHLGIKKPLVSCHEHNEQQRAQDIIADSRAGRMVAVVSDAGMPGISDPGGAVARAAAQAGEPFTVAPGASAALTSLVLSALPCDRFVFEGFLPRDKKPRRARLEALRREPRTAILYESPFRLRDTLEELLRELGDRPAAVCRELTKFYEETRRAPLSELASHYEQNPPKGECVLVLSGAPPQESPAQSEEEQLQAMQALIDRGMKPKEAAKQAAATMTSAQLYNRYMKPQNNG